jgi:hypothetical protein
MMGKIILILAVMTAMTMSAAFAMDEDVKKPPQDMIERHDQDGDNRVSKEEFPGPDDHFTQIDADGDGFINREEARNARRPDRQGGRVPGKFNIDDADGDGVVSRSEFSGPADHFHKLDTNGDDVIQKSEAMQGPPGMPSRDRKNQ